MFYGWPVVVAATANGSNTTKNELGCRSHTQLQQQKSHTKRCDAFARVVEEPVSPLGAEIRSIHPACVRNRRLLSVPVETILKRGLPHALPLRQA